MASNAGRKKVPTAIKKLRGTLQPCRVLDNEISPALSAAVPAPPDDLNDDGKELWWLTVTQAHELKLLTKIALPQIIDYCTQWQIYCRHRRLVLAVETPGVAQYSNGNEGLSASYKVMVQARKEMRHFESGWGLTPSSAAGIPGKEGNEDHDEFDI